MKDMNENAAVVKYVLVESRDTAGHSDEFDLIREENFDPEDVENEDVVVTRKVFRTHDAAATFRRLRTDWGALMRINMMEDPDREETDQQIKELGRQMNNLSIPTE